MLRTLCFNLQHFIEHERDVNMLPRVSVTNNAGSVFDERVRLLLKHQQYLQVIIALSLFLHFIIYSYTYTRSLLVTQLKHRN
jgi:hypothetical protein